MSAGLAQGEGMVTLAASYTAQCRFESGPCYWQYPQYPSSPVQ